MHHDDAPIRVGPGRFGGRLAIVLLGLGLLSIGLAWNGAAGTTLLQDQFAFLISGGLIGLSLVIVGSALMVLQGYREERARLEAKLDQLVWATQRGGVPAGASAPADLAGLVIAGSASYHAPGCRLVDGREEIEYLTPEEAQRRFLQPCRVCSPEQSNSNVNVV
jgi:hypothetical protein